MFVLIVIFSYFIETDGFYTQFLNHGRLHRHCHQSSVPVAVLPVEESKFGLFFILLSGLIFFLIFLGLIKGLIGWCCFSKVGMYGLNLLIELPRPLARYQEKNLENRPVIYDIGGWPVHPDTLERTVRILPKRTEFCLNLIFFLAYPLAACVYICALCCCIRNLSKSNEDACFKHVDVVRLTSCEKPNDNKRYKEEQDTKYVIDAMQKSRESLQELTVNIKGCPCE